MVDSTTTAGPSLGASVILFFGFLVICFGLGYATLNRYDPRVIGNTDSVHYYAMIEHADGVQIRAPYAYRLLTPTLAGGVLKVLSPFDFGSFDRIFLSLLVVNSVFAALSAVLIMQIAGDVVGEPAAVAVAPLLYLSSFAVVNFHLAGLVDAGEGFFLIALLLALMRDRWPMMPLLIAIGVAAKETVLPLGVCAMVVWCAAARVRKVSLPRSAMVVVPTSLAAGLGSLWLCRYLGHVPPLSAHRFSWSRLVDVFPNAADCLFPESVSVLRGSCKNRACSCGRNGDDVGAL